MEDKVVTPQTGCFIVVEGLPGSGRNTQFRLLESRLLSEGYDVETYSFPRHGTPSSFFVDEYTKGNYGKQKTVGPYSASVFYSLDKYQIASKIRSSLSTGKVVIAEMPEGSNMALHADMIGDLESRHGYYLWLEAIEYKMFNIPRPDLSLVLSVPYEILNSGKDGEVNPAKHRRSTVIYNELCQIFPSEYRMIDCTRDNKLMPEVTLQNHIWETIHPYLPPKNLTRSKTPELNRLDSSRFAKDISNNDQTPSLVTKNESLIFPTTLDAKSANNYRKKISQILSIRSEIETKLSEHILSKFENNGTTRKNSTLDASNNANKICRSILPVSALFSSTTINGSENPGTNTLKLQQAGEFSKLAKDYLSSSYSDPSSQEDVILVQAHPRNELDTIPNILYEYSEDPLSRIKEKVGDWSYEKKSNLLISYLEDLTSEKCSTKGTPEIIQYTWDVFCDYETFDTLKNLLGSNVTRQQLSPRYGFNIPGPIEDANLVESFERCFEISLSLYSDLQAEGYTQEAEYATLLGHKLRSRLVTSVAQLFDLGNVQPDNTKSSKLSYIVDQIQQSINAVHPITASRLFSQTKSRPWNTNLNTTNQDI